MVEAVVVEAAAVAAAAHLMMVETVVTPVTAGNARCIRQARANFATMVSSRCMVLADPAGVTVPTVTSRVLGNAMFANLATYYSTASALRVQTTVSSVPNQDCAILVTKGIL